MRLYLPEGDHVFRAGFIDDEFVKIAARARRVQPPEEQVPRLDHVHRPVRADDGEGEPEEDPHLRPGVRPRVRRADRDRSRAPRVPAPAARARGRFARCASSTWRRRSGQSAEQGMQLAIQAMLVSPNFLFRIERDPDPRDPALVHEVSPFELASRVSYFLWSSMPDDELLALAESGKLARPARARGAGRSDARRPARGGVCRELRRPVARNAQSRCRQAGSGQVQGVDSRAARRDEDRDDDVLRARAAREPSGQRFPERRIHVPQRAARGALRHRAVSPAPSSAGSS